MATIWFISDTHFGHANILTFKRADGHLMRTKPGGYPFQDVTEMDEFMIERWNSVVRAGDKVYHLGDLAMKLAGGIDRIMCRLHGHKRLVRGNHDRLPTKHYMRWFEEIHGVRIFEGLVLSHVPLHPRSVRGTNVHGHLHSNNLGDPDFALPKYLNVSVECIDYTPISLEEVRATIKAAGGDK